MKVLTESRHSKAQAGVTESLQEKISRQDVEISSLKEELKQLRNYLNYDDEKAPVI